MVTTTQGASALALSSQNPQQPDGKDIPDVWAVGVATVNLVRSGWRSIGSYLSAAIGVSPVVAAAAGPRDIVAQNVLFDSEKTRFSEEAARLREQGERMGKAEEFLAILRPILFASAEDQAKQLMMEYNGYPKFIYAIQLAVDSRQNLDDKLALLVLTAINVLSRDEQIFIVFSRLIHVTYEIKGYVRKNCELNVLEFCAIFFYPDMPGCQPQRNLGAGGLASCRGSKFRYSLMQLAYECVSKQKEAITELMLCYENCAELVNGYPQSSADSIRVNEFFGIDIVLRVRMPFFFDATEIQSIAWRHRWFLFDIMRDHGVDVVLHILTNEVPQNILLAVLNAPVENDLRKRFDHQGPMNYFYYAHMQAANVCEGLGSQITACATELFTGLAERTGNQAWRESIGAVRALKDVRSDAA
jgi:hypothetical protein